MQQFTSSTLEIFQSLLLQVQVKVSDPEFETLSQRLSVAKKELEDAIRGEADIQELADDDAGSTTG